jgi:hypothetical protein
MAFADEVRRLLALLNPQLASYRGEGVSFTWQGVIEEFGYDKMKVTFPEVRRLQQVFATEVVRENMDENFWVKAVARKIKRSLDPVFLISDCRFENEWTCLDERFEPVRLVWVKRSGSEESEHASEKISEWIVNKRHATITNDGSLKDLEIKVANYLKLWRLLK